MCPVACNVATSLLRFPAEHSTNLALPLLNAVRLMMDSLKNKGFNLMQHSQRYHRFYSMHSSSLSKPDTYITRYTARPPTVQTVLIWVCYANGS